MMLLCRSTDAHLTHHPVAGGVGPKEFLAGVDYLEVKSEPQVSVWQRDLNDRMHSARTTAAGVVIGKH
jgi:hypothetical protein